MDIIINENNITKAEIIAQAQAIIDKVIVGELDPLKVHVYAKAMKEAWELIASETQGYALDEAEKYGKEGKVFGASFRLSSTGDRYDYEADQTYRDLKEKLKQREELLKQAVKSRVVLVDDETGEQIPKVPVKSSSKQTLNVSFK